jgi:hypothetical protein
MIICWCHNQTVLSDNGNARLVRACIVVGTGHVGGGDFAFALARFHVKSLAHADHTSLAIFIAIVRLVTRDAIVFDDIGGSVGETVPGRCLEGFLATVRISKFRAGIVNEQTQVDRTTLIGTVGAQVVGFIVVVVIANFVLLALNGGAYIEIGVIVFSLYVAHTALHSVLRETSVQACFFRLLITLVVAVANLRVMNEETMIERDTTF